MFTEKRRNRPFNALISAMLFTLPAWHASAVENKVPPAASDNDAKGQPAKEPAAVEDVMKVNAPRLVKQAGTATRISAEDMQRHGGNDFGTIMRYQPLISATGSSAGSSSGKSGFDRSGYTGYNIRGLESNRVAIDVDGIPLPNATGRAYASRAGLGTFGIGRDYIDPYMYGQVDIASGATPIARANTAIGGAVSFLPKSPDDYLSYKKNTYFGYQSDYDSANRAWHNGITAAAGDEELRGLVVISRRDGQETRTNSDSADAFPANWHSTAIMTSGIWQPNEEHQFTGTAEYYDKTNHTHFDTWNSAGSSVIGTSRQQSDTRRWSLSVKDRWTPIDLGWVDQLDTQLYYQNAEAHDNTDMPLTAATRERVQSDYNVDTWGFDSRWLKTVGIHALSAGLNARQSETERPFAQFPAPSIYTAIMQPEADSRTYTLGGFVQDRISLDLAGHGFAIVPGARAVYQNSKPTNLSSLASGSAVLTPGEVESLYGKTNSDTQILPSLSFLYDLTPAMTTYLQYKRGAQFPDASQLYGSWNLGSSYAGSQQYALIGNSDLKTETSNNFEWGLKGDITPGVTFNGALFYNTYKNFIANTRYTRSANPGEFTRVPGNIFVAYKAENRDKAYIYGGEFSSKFNFGTWFESVNGLSATVAFGYNKGKSKSSYMGDDYVDLDSVAPMKAIVGLAWDDPGRRYGTAITSTFQKGKKATATNRQSYTNSGGALTDATTDYMRIPGYGLVDLTAYWQVAKNVKLSGGIYNLTDRKYWDYLSSRQLTNVTRQDFANQALAVEPGRSFQVGVNVDF
ncbi:TonB-dependent receptor domain-containing protein [Sodalis sp. RH14]|uniref:TonB-dependent receptor domain-containing protein n=1 Tax=Sodalis sp. RH14 TaxID=3394329 RepID=UPI0039B40B61